jgi:TatD DNase family protein
LIAQMDLAQELDKPVVIHDRAAHAELMQILRERRGKPRGVLHCFSGDLEMARQAIDLGYYVSFAGNVTFKNARQLQEIVRALPLEHILVETDSPYLSPRRGQRNEPANIALVAAKIAELKNIATPVVEQATERNSQALFGLP